MMLLEAVSRYRAPATDDWGVFAHGSSQIRFEDGAAYERMMGTWSRLAGEIFLDWLAPRSGLCWIDVRCGNGAFTELLVERYAPTEVQGISIRSAARLCTRPTRGTRGGVPPGRRYGASAR